MASTQGTSRTTFFARITGLKPPCLPTGRRKAKKEEPVDTSLTASAMTSPMIIERVSPEERYKRAQARYNALLSAKVIEPTGKTGASDKQIQVCQNIAFKELVYVHGSLAELYHSAEAVMPQGPESEKRLAQMRREIRDIRFKIAPDGLDPELFPNSLASFFKEIDSKLKKHENWEEEIDQVRANLREYSELRRVCPPDVLEMHVEYRSAEPLHVELYGASKECLYLTHDHELESALHAQAKLLEIEINQEVAKGADPRSGKVATYISERCAVPLFRDLCDIIEGYVLDTSFDDVEFPAPENPIIYTHPPLDPLKIKIMAVYDELTDVMGLEGVEGDIRSTVLDYLDLPPELL